MYCKKCGKQIPEDANLCPYCGISLINNADEESIPAKLTKNKKKGCLFGCLGLFIIMVLFGFIAGLLSDKNSSEVATTSQTKVEKHALKIGDTFKSNAFELTITGKDVTKRVTDRHGYMYSEADGVFVVVHVHYKNIANSAKRLDNSAFQLISNGKQYTPVTLTVNLNDNIFLDQINPGIEKDGDVYFDVPEDVANSNLTLKLSSSFMSDNFNGEVELY